MKSNYFPDPLGIRKSAVNALKDSKFVSINQEKIKEFAQNIKEKIENNELVDEWQFGKFEKTSQHIFIQDTVNFCFWAKKNEKKWKVEYPKGKIEDGWKALVNCFDRAHEERIPIDDCEFLEDISLEQVKNIFRSCNGTEIPLLEKRWELLKESGKVLRQKFEGNIINLIKKADFDAIEIAKNVVKYFPSFRDPFYKRAQIFPYDVSLLKNMRIKNTNQLTAFADYRLPQILREFGVLAYKKELAEKIDSYILLKSGNHKETEIRSATIIACDLIAKEIKVMPVTAENALWSLSQKWKSQHPYHRILTTNY
ncbi:MAG: hypothetical protein HY424_01355 [Candidatus Levybacteria bacterium]|nr:hypothetical protein [Candidatus Levybacteria bacterium]